MILRNKWKFKIADNQQERLEDRFKYRTLIWNLMNVNQYTQEQVVEFMNAYADLAYAVVTIDSLKKMTTL